MLIDEQPQCSSMFSLPKTLSAQYLKVSPFKRVVLFRTLKRVVARHLLFSKFNTLLCLTALLVCARLLILVCPTKQKSLLMKCAPEHALSMLKSNSFISKWKRVVSVLSPLSLFSCGGSHIKTLEKDIFCLGGSQRNSIRVS